ncbi:MAG: hypothetical protein ACRDUY_07910 [Nitriliruptorales bacterium]
MAVEERRRVALRQQVAATWGEEAADTLFELVTPAGHDVATKGDILRLEERMDARFAAVDARFASVEQRLVERMESLEHRLVGVFERRIADAVTSQTRTIVLSQLAALVAIAGLAFGLR